jgi:DNA-binding XRE family transcriptional regulator
MDQWDFKKWRKKLGINQVAAGEMLGLSRGAVQQWESEIRPVPRAVELACQELLRRWKQRPEFGPVTLLYADGPVPQVDSLFCGDLVLRCEPHPDNESALGRVVRLRETVNLFMPWKTMELSSGQDLKFCMNAMREKSACMIDRHRRHSGNRLSRMGAPSKPRFLLR